MAVTGTTPIGSPWDKGQVLELLGTGITTSYQYTEVVPDGTSPAKFPPLQQSGQARQLALYVYGKTGGASSVTTITISVEVCYGDPAVAANWAQVLSKVHKAGGTTNVNSAVVLGAAPQEATVMVTCTEFALAKHVRVGAKGDAAGSAGDIVRLFAVAW